MRRVLTTAFSIGLLVFSNSSIVFAELVPFKYAPPEDVSNLQKAHWDVSFTGGGEPDVCDTTDTGGSDITLRGSTNLERVFNYMRDKGLSPEQAAGVVGNVQQESGGNPINAQVGPDTKDPAQFGYEVGVGRAWGLIQWDAGGRAIKYAEQAHITGPIYKIGTQLQIVWWHMNNISPTSAQNMLPGYKNISDVEAAVRYYEEKMEGAGEPMFDNRYTFAKEALRKYGGGGSETGSTTDTSPTTSSSCDSSSDGGGGTATLNGFTFPLITTQAAIKKGSQYNGSTLIWCYTSQISCHHDYNAADIHVLTGTTVIAAKEGTVASANYGNQHPNNVTIDTDDGKGINYYTHMGANTLKVRQGQHVLAKDRLGKVGTAQDAMYTAPHLHFDMLPPTYKYRVECSGSACSGYPFIEVQPVLVETFKKLPEK